MPLILTMRSGGETVPTSWRIVRELSLIGERAFFQCPPELLRHSQPALGEGGGREVISLEGIKLGATRIDVVKAYGEPDAKMGPTHYWYAKRGWQFSFRDGNLVSYQLNPPNPL